MSVGITEDPGISDDFSDAGPLTETVQLGNVAIHFLRKKLEWDTGALRITNLEAANSFLTTDYRPGREVEASP